MMRATRRGGGRRLTWSYSLVVPILLASTQAWAQFPPAELENLQVLPEDTTPQELIGVMRGFATGLGVRCQHCHVGEEGQTLTEFDFAADTKEAKKKARVMLRMTRAINDSHLEELGEGRLRVECVTCHRGQSRPAQLGQRLTEALDAGGVEDAIATYRRLRDEFYGGHSFDFTEWTLIFLGESLFRGGRTDEAEAMLRLNLEYYRESTASWNFLAELYRQLGRNDEAKTAVAKVLELDPSDRRAKQIQSALDAGGDGG